MVYKGPRKTVWVCLGPVKRFRICRFSVSPHPNNPKKRISRASGLGLICFPTTHPQAGWHPRASPARGVCFLSLPGDTCWSRAHRCGEVVADHQLVFSHLCQHGSHRVPKSVPAHAGDADPLEGRLDLLLQHRSQVERFLSLQTVPAIPRERSLCWRSWNRSDYNRWGRISDAPRIFHAAHVAQDLLVDKGTCNVQQNAA